MLQLQISKRPLPTPVPYVSIVVPTYRESGNLAELIERIGVIRQRAPAIELIIVDDDSNDGTQELIASLNQPWIHLLVRCGERGLSSAVIRGLEAATGDLVVVMDA